MNRLITFVFLTISLNVASQEIDSIRLLQNLQTLSSDEYSGRGTEQAGGELARTYLIDQFQKIGLEPFDEEYMVPIKFWNWMSKKKVNGFNLTGRIKGGKYPEKYIVVSAHYDHLGIKDGTIYNGADDNASGTWALIELADFYKKNPPQHSMIFVAFDAEELGLQGAKCFVDEPPVPRENIILNINMDMIGRNAKNELYICGTHHYPNLKKIIEPTTIQSPIQVLFGHDNPKSKQQDWTYSSDHGIFHKEKIPFLYFGVEDHKDYHKSTDDFENIQPAFYTQAAHLVLSCLMKIDQELSSY